MNCSDKEVASKQSSTRCLNWEFWRYGGRTKLTCVTLLPHSGVPGHPPCHWTGTQQLISNSFHELCPPSLSIISAHRSKIVAYWNLCSFCITARWTHLSGKYGLHFLFWNRNSFPKFSLFTLQRWAGKSSYVFLTTM